MYELTVSSRFAAAHQLRNYKGRCERLHGHNWKVQVTVTARELNEIGLGMDFTEIKDALQNILESVDHHFLNDLPMFKSRNPSSENIAKWVSERLSEHLDDGNVQVARVTIWESEDACATYVRDGALRPQD